MKVSLAGLLQNAAAQIRKPDPDWAEFYAFSLEEAAQHARETAAGDHTVAEFAAHYCLSGAKP
jgi:hypothetical protein